MKMALDDFYAANIHRIYTMCACNTVKSGNDKIEITTDGKVVMMTIRYHNNIICRIRRSVYGCDIRYATSSCGWNTWSTARRINNILARLHDPMRFHRGGSTVTTGYYKGTELVVKGEQYFSEGWDL